MMKNRGDFEVFLEPFGNSAYYSGESILALKTDEKIESNPEYNCQVIVQKLVSTSKEKNVFIKDFPLHFNDIVDNEFLSFFQNTFLIRDPAQMLPSYIHKWPNLTFEETSYRQLYQLFNRVVEFTGQIPPLIDADDLIRDPESIIRIFCEQVNIPFKPEALRWESPGKNVKEMCWWDKGSWHDRLSTTEGFSEQVRPDYLTIDDSKQLSDLYKMCLPYTIFQNSCHRWP